MSFTVVIPARFASSRLAGKPLADIAGKPMIQHVHERACRSGAGRVVVATDDDRIRRACDGFGADVVMTSPDHASGTDRLEEVARYLGLADDARVINVQGDEPLIPPALIDQVAQSLLAYPDAGIATLCEAIATAEALFDANVVKVVRDAEGFAHYFSRAPIPWARDGWAGGEGARRLPGGGGYFRHIGIYGYRAGLLHRFVAWPPAPAEQSESLEQLRALYHGVRIHVAEACEHPPAGVDTAADLERVRTWLMQNDRRGDDG